VLQKRSPGVAEHEREMISARTKAALAGAKRRSVKLGSPDPRCGSAAGIEVIRARAAAHAANVLPIVNAVCAAGETTLRGIAEARNRRGIRTSRGGAWHAQSVARLLAAVARGSAPRSEAARRASQAAG
jgi:DNA invertase Pin-like site-specific DNA recombinase